MIVRTLSMVSFSLHFAIPFMATFFCQEDISLEMEEYWSRVTQSASTSESKQSRFAGYLEGKFNIKVPDWWGSRLNYFSITEQTPDLPLKPARRPFEIKEDDDSLVVNFGSNETRYELFGRFLGSEKGASFDCLLLHNGGAIVAMFFDSRNIFFSRIDKSSNIVWEKKITFRPEDGGRSGPHIPETLELVQSVDSIILFVAKPGKSYLYRIDLKSGKELSHGQFRQLGNP